MLNNDDALNLFCEKYAKDLILSCFGDEATLYANNFKFTEFHLEKYYNLIIKYKEQIKGKNILDIGSNTGIWSVLMCLNGATNVTCIEPRRQLANGINHFSKMHNLPITAINDLHPVVFDLDTIFDTTVMMGVDDSIPDILAFMNKLKNTTNFLILKTDNHDDVVAENSIRLEMQNNFHLRGGFNINTNLEELNDDGMQADAKSVIDNPKQGRFLRQLYGKNFYETVFDYLEYEIVDFTSHDKTNSTSYQYKTYLVRLK